MKKIIGFVLLLAGGPGCRYEPELLSDYYGFVRISSSDERSALRPVFREGGKKIYYFARGAGDSLHQLRAVNRDGGERKVLTALEYNPEKLPELSPDECFVVYEKTAWDSNGYLPYPPRLRKFYPDSALKAAAREPQKQVDLYRFDFASGRETRLTRTGNAYLFGFLDQQSVLYYTLEDSILYLDPARFYPVRRVNRYFALSLFSQDRREVNPVSLYPSPAQRRSLLAEVVDDYADKDFNRYRYFLVDSTAEKYLLVWTGGNAAFNRGRPPQVEWLDERRFVTKTVKTSVLAGGLRADLNPASDSARLSFAHKGEVWEIDVNRGKSRKLCKIKPDFDFALSGDRRFLFAVYAERGFEVLVRVNTVTGKQEEIGRIAHGHLADLAPNLTGSEAVFTLRDGRGKGTVYRADLTHPKWKTSPPNPSP